MPEEVNCAACGFANNSKYSFCRRCGSLLEDYSAEPEQKLELALIAPGKKKGPFTLIELMIVIAIIGIFVAIAIPSGGRRNHHQARMKACFANQRVIMGAIEMYNMDNNEFMRHMDETALKSLIEGRYLKSMPNCPAYPPGQYVSDGDISQDGTIRCTVHGSVENPINPDL
ncbi:MAG: hypothetical protein CVV42_02205 [Candidatus Riflebacteria bacterium HGW-Riflebacteria-2]|jgi:general secretion pathway protein G|nr:MAG: hypothetical protein CVV42_02205 [Candidatus Riflebacteria bacterium HGW-Riflebacteria-2]